MKKITLCLMAIAISLAAPLAAEDGMNEIGRVFVDRLRAEDLDGMVALFAEDATSFPPDSMVAQGRDAIRESWAGFFEIFRVQEAALMDAHHMTCGDLSVAWGRYRIVVVPRQGGDPMVLEGRFADAAKKIEGKWQYVMDHASGPLPPTP